MRAQELAYLPLRPCSDVSLLTCFDLTNLAEKAALARHGGVPAIVRDGSASRPISSADRGSELSGSDRSSICGCPSSSFAVRLAKETNPSGERPSSTVRLSKHPVPLAADPMSARDVLSAFRYAWPDRTDRVLANAVAELAVDWHHSLAQTRML